MSILMIGTRRSGSNLTRLMLDQLPGVEAPQPAHILQKFMPLLPNYGDLSKPSTFRLLVDDVCQLVELNPVPWEGVTLNADDIISRCTQRSLVAIFSSIYDVLAETRGAKMWCCKSVENVYYLPEIHAYLPNARYLHLYRDGRDVAVSFRKAIIGEKHFYHIAQEWAQAQRAALKMSRRLGESQFFGLSYEKLTGQPEDTLQTLCAFLGVDYDPSMLDFHKSDAAKSTASSSSLWCNLAQPVMNQNSQKFLTQASAEDVKIFELVAGDALDMLGYERTQTSPGDSANFTAEEVARFNAQNQQLKAQAQETKTSNDQGSRVQQDALLKMIQERSSSSTSTLLA
ncbi:MAG: sulfotransferase [Elainellaceae cyanobacterium]